ncbi:MAG: redoxin family protein [Planctomycetota bacterium]
MQKNRFLSLLAASAVALGAVSLAMADKEKGEKKEQKAGAVEIGSAAPDFKLPTADGKTVSLADFKGKTVVIEWFSPYCPYSGQSSDDSYWSTGRAKQVIDAMKAADASAVYLCINSTHDGYSGKDTAANMKDSTSAVASSPVPVLMDASGSVGHAYGAKTTPHVFIVDGAGNIAYIGAPVSKDGKDLYAANAVKAIKEGKKPEPARTKNSGCGVKYAKQA